MNLTTSGTPRSTAAFDCTGCRFAESIIFPSPACNASPCTLCAQYANEKLSTSITQTNTQVVVHLATHCLMSFHRRIGRLQGGALQPNGSAAWRPRFAVLRADWGPWCVPWSVASVRGHRIAHCGRPTRCLVHGSRKEKRQW